MSSTMEYRHYVGSVEFSEADGLFYGQVLGIRSLISYEGATAAELVQDFHGAVDDYLAACAAEGSSPETAYKGSLNIRLGAELHRQAAVYAINHRQSLNSLIEQAVREKLAGAAG
ncbi:MAG: type II toxin-antitoxin system HicB family antitoxin [Clostridia bacterium]|nr:type II toxin-antitoxin system HicB family antitoxin [Clostridia bacterium]